MKVNNKINKEFKQTVFSNLVSRRDYSKIDTSFFVESDLLENQIKSYNKFLKQELDVIFSSYFPISHPKNPRYEVRYNGFKVKNPTSTEEEARDNNRSYEYPLYVDLSMIDNETGEIKKNSHKKSKKNDDISDGLTFFANIPAMTKSGSFVVNGCEKIVISQLTRSPGVYIFNKSQIKLVSKKKINTGRICEIFPSRGTLINLWVDENAKVIYCFLRDFIGKDAPKILVTQLLKGFGMSQQEIINIFSGNEYITNSLKLEVYNTKNIFDNKEIIETYSFLSKEKNKNSISGSPIDEKFKKSIINSFAIKNEYDAIKNEYDSLLKNKSNSDEAKKTKAKLDKKYEELEEVTSVLISEKAAKDLVNDLKISIKAIEKNISDDKKSVNFCYCDILCQRFMDNRVYDLNNAGRYKINRKLCATERLYQRVLAQDIVLVNGKKLFSTGQLILKEELDIIKSNIESDKLIFPAEEIEIVNTSKFIKKCKKVEKILVYADNELQTDVVPIIGVLPTNTLTTLTLADFISAISYTIGLNYEIGTYDDKEHLGNKRFRLICDQLKSKLFIGMARVEKYIKEKLASLSIGTANDENKAKIEAKTTLRSVVNTKAFQLVVKSFFNTYQLTQFADQQNPLSILSNKRKISLLGDGGVSREDPNLDIRDIHSSYYSRICPTETPEGQNIGLIMSLAAFAKVDDNGFVVAPYKKVVNGVITNEIEWLTPLKEEEHAICGATVNVDAKNKITDEQVVARYRGEEIMLSPSGVHYADVSPRQVLSVSTGQIPFIGSDDGVRTMYASNMQRQAVPLVKPIAATIGSGSEYKIAKDSGVTVTAEEDGEVIFVDANKIVIANKNDKKTTYKLIKYRRSNQNTSVNQIPIVNVGQKVVKDEIIADGPATQNGELALGRNPLIAFTTWDGFNMDDAIVISERLVKDEVFTSLTIEEHIIQCMRTKNGDEEITRDIPNVSEDAKSCLDEDGIVLVGSYVEEGDILVGKILPRGQVDYSAEEKLLQAIFGNKSKNFKDASLRVPHGGGGIVIRVQRFSAVNGSSTMDDDVIEKIKIFIVQKRKIQVGDKLAGCHGNKGIISIVLPEEDMPYLEDGTPIDICLNPQGVPSRMNIGQIYEVNLAMAMREIAKKKMIEFINANKIDVKEISLLFGISVEKVESLKKFVARYLKEQGDKEIDELDLNIILNNVGLTYEDLNYKVANPVFSGANSNDVFSTMQEAGMEPEKKYGKYKLIDGRTGEYFNGEITVGTMNILKLNHMVEDKIHARATGPYSKITQQPLGGKRQNGGQKVGEMEVWALEAYGVAHTLQEMLTIKSDDIDGREKLIRSIIRGKKLPLPGMPESFKLLTKQLQGLCLSMSAELENGDIVDINKYTNDIDIDDENDENASNDQQEKNTTFLEEINE